MSTKTTTHSSSPPKRTVQARPAQQNLQRAPMGGGPNPSGMQKRLGNRGTLTWLAEQGGGQPVQAKLSVGEPNDMYEQEADRVAETVMRMPEPAMPEEEETKVQAKPIANQITPLVRRMPEEAIEEDPVVQQMSKSESEEDEENVVAQRVPFIEPEEGDKEEEIGQAKLDAPIQAKFTIRAQPLQAKLTVGQPDDMYEQEADRVAETVTRMPEPDVPEDEETEVQAKPIANQITPLVQRMPEEEAVEEEPIVQQMSGSEEDEESVVAQRMSYTEAEEGDEEEEIAQTKLDTDYSPDIQRQMDEDEEEEIAQAKPLGNRRIAGNQTQIQTKGPHTQTPEVTPDVTANVNTLKSGGSPLPQPTRAFFEPRFGADFSQVRIHTDSRAADTATSINAKAFTVGENIAFGKGQYAPESQTGKRLLGHELTHTVQQDQEKTDQTNIDSTSIQRFGSKEHMQLGDVTGKSIDIGGGVELTFGQIVALAGDEFESLEQLQDSMNTPSGRALIRAHLEQAGIGGSAVTYLPEPTDSQRSQAQSEYITLAMNNIPHFVEGGTALTNWSDHHNKAIDLAIQAGLSQDQPLLNKAYMTEAFGQHFLTDAFSSGHLRVPRAEITDYYTTDFAPKVFDHILDYFRDRLIDEIYDQVEKQTVLNEIAWFIGFPFGGLAARKYIRNKIKNAINDMLKEAFSKMGGRAGAIRYLGLGLAGIVAGAMHDMENEVGLWVVSDFQPEPWFELGDGKLDDPKSWEQKGYIELAVLASVEDIEKANKIGIEEGQELFNLLPTDQLPGRILFNFNSDKLLPEAESALFSLANYMKFHPSTVLAVVGHADPIGTEEYNDDLAFRRANTVSNYLYDQDVDASTLNVESAGENRLITRDPKKYQANRRVEFIYSSAADAGDQEPDEIAIENTLMMVQDKIGPPFAAEAYLPRLAKGLNSELPEWKWGSIPERFRGEMKEWIRKYVEEFKDDALSSDALNEIEVEGYVVQPRPIAERIMAEISADAIKFLENAVGKSAGPK